MKKILTKILCSWNDISKFEIVNFLTIMFTTLSIVLKHTYDHIFMQEDFLSKSFYEYTDITKFYAYHEILFVIDAIAFSFYCISAIKYIFFWIPSLSKITESFYDYINSSVKKIIYFIIFFSLALSVFFNNVYG